jgi:DnaJ-class molecular chaperone
VRPDKKHKPLAVCNVCHAMTNLHEDLNNRCSHPFNGRRCYGTYKSGISNLWDPCEGCDATGQVGSQICSACAGFGWTLYA